MKKVSIIVPNYNNADYICECLDSISRQKYLKKEIIIVDDGSTDSSVERIEDYINLNKDLDIKLFQQSNLNASIARNKGMENADGDYVLFMDSDDLLEDGVLEQMVQVCESEKTDLVIGGYRQIDEHGNIYGENAFTDDNVILNPRKDYLRLMNIKPAPPNKLYKLDIIRKNKLVWGNVRIGQDLDFYLKYLSLCKKVSIINLCIYRYRATPNSMTRSFDFRIFDIVNVFEDVERFYKRNNTTLLYSKYLPMCALRHYESEMTKQMYYRDRKTRNLIVRFFSVCEKHLDYSKCEMDSEYKKIYLKFKIKCFIRPILTSSIYCKCKTKKRK